MDAQVADRLRDRCLSVLDANWLGRATKPAPQLYPHRWSWDSAFIAIGNRHHRWDRAALELTTLFEAQWSSGMLPHIVFENERGDYFPSASFWDTRVVVSPDLPRPTSGICQPPVHATAVRLVVEAATSDHSGLGLARDLVPKLSAWHDYLHSTRAVDGSLVEVWHPWETGMDNSPAWDEPLSRMQFSSDEVPRYRRVDTTHADTAVRPSDTDYDRYAFLVARLRQEAYEPADPRSLPFRVRDVLFNSVLARAELDLGALVDRLGGDGDGRRRLGRDVAAAIDRNLWSDDAQWYLSQDASTRRLLPSRTAGGMMPLLCGIESRERRERLLRTFEDVFASSVSDDATALRTSGRDEVGFDPNRYWRGPAWVNTTWMAADGLRRSGEVAPADRLLRGLVHLAGEIGIFEYFDPDDAVGLGSDDFSWTAALTLDILETRPDLWST